MTIRLTPNDILKNRYRIIRNFRRGGMGCVDLALDLQTRENVVIKYAAIEEKVESVDKNRFKNVKIPSEAEIIRACNHPNVVKYIDFFSDQGANFLVEVYNDGETVKNLLKLGPLPEFQIIKIGNQILQALTHIHGKGIIYRDMKPENIIVKRDGDAVLIDFGGAIMFKTNEPDEYKGTIIFTEGYEAPEQRAGRCSVATDTFGMGLTLYEMCTAKPPPPIRPLPPANMINARISPDLSQIITNATEVDIQKRYKTAMDMCWALEKIAPKQTGIGMSSPVKVSPVISTPVKDPRLIFKNGMNESVYRITKNAITIGREIPGHPTHLKPDVCVIDGSVSFNPKIPGNPNGHARIWKDNEGNYWIEDLMSKNGTFLNNMRIARACRLKNGDFVQLGPNTMFQFRED